MQAHEPARPGGMAIEDVTGFWRIAPISGGKAACLIALNSLSAAHGYQVHTESCTIPAFTATASWRPVEGGFELLDGSGHPITGFRRQDVDTFRAIDGTYRMERAAAGA